MEREAIQEDRGPAESSPGSFSKDKVPHPDITDLRNFLKNPRDILSVAVIGVFLLGFVAFLFFARVFFLPVVLAVILSFLFKPVVRGLARIRIPEPVGAAVTLAVALFILGNGVSRLTQPAAQWAAQAPESLRQVERKLVGFLQPAKQINAAAAQVENITAGPAAENTTQVELKRFHLADTMLSYTTSFLTGALETIVLLYFLLASGDLFLQKLVKVMPSLHDKKHAVEIAHEVQHNISTFLFTITWINIGLGVAVGLMLYFVGMPNAVLWGVMAALLNFIPYFGPIAGVAILTLAGLMTFDSMGQVVAPPLLYLGLHALEANFVTPMVLGRRLTLNPVVIFVSLMFWTWMWGIPGALLAVPLLMVLKIFCDHFKPLASVGEFLSG